MSSSIRDQDAPGGLKSAARWAFIRMPGGFQRRVIGDRLQQVPWVNGAPPVAPPVPAGMETGAPDFVGIGVAKSGTTWWFSLMMHHPEIHVEHDKELNYFNLPFTRKLAAGEVSEADALAYREWFPRPAGTITGEWTPHYAFFRLLPPVMRAAAGEARLLMMLRDPVERYRSDLSRPMPARALERLRYRSIPHGMYSNVLRPWEALYAPEEMLVLQFEQCRRNTDHFLAETFRFLGIDDSFRPKETASAVNQSRQKMELDPFVVEQLVELYTPDVLALVERHPHLDLSLWPNFAHLANQPTFPAPAG
jgi:hypothetical protein